MDPDLRHYAIWWTTNDEAKAIAAGSMRRIPIDYRHEFLSRVGRNGRGRLWVTRCLAETGINFAVNPWPDTPFTRELELHYGGLVFFRDGRDVLRFVNLGGVVTDFELQGLTCG